MKFQMITVVRPSQSDSRKSSKSTVSPYIFMCMMIGDLLHLPQAPRGLGSLVIELNFIAGVLAKRFLFVIESRIASLGHLRREMQPVPRYPGAVLNKIVQMYSTILK